MRSQTDGRTALTPSVAGLYASQRAGGEGPSRTRIGIACGDSHDTLTCALDSRQDGHSLRDGTSVAAREPLPPVHSGGGGSRVNSALADRRDLSAADRAAAGPRKGRLVDRAPDRSLRSDARMVSRPMAGFGQRRGRPASFARATQGTRRSLERMAAERRDEDARVWIAEQPILSFRLPRTRGCDPVRSTGVRRGGVVRHDQSLCGHGDESLAREDSDAGPRSFPTETPPHAYAGARSSRFERKSRA